MHFSTATVLAFAASASAYSSTQRSFAVNHFYGNGPLVMGRMDPIVSPGIASSHSHAVQGGNAFALTMTDEQALSSTCTSSLVKNDKSNYWTPSLYFHADNGSFISVPMFYMNVYYFFEATTDVIKAFEPGHRMVIGNPSLRSPPATGGRSILDLADGVPNPVQFTCPRSSTSQPLYPVDSDGLHGAGIQDPGNAGAGVGFPDQNCDGYASPLRADIHFPSCYDPSKNISDYKNNMVWPTHGNCPPGFVHTPHLFYEVYWNTPLFANEWTPGQGKQPFVLSNGDPTGYSLHADFISGWDVGTLQQIIENCDAGDSGMDKCPGLIGGLNDPSTSCNIECPIQEQVLGEMELLPGNNPLGQWGVAPAAAGGSTTPASPPAPVKISTPVASAAPVKSSTPATSAAAAAGKPVGSSANAAAPVATSPAGGKAAGPSPGAPSDVVKTIAPVKSTHAAPAAPATTAVAPPAVVPGKGSGGSNTLITSYVSETTVIWTTVTAPRPAPTSSSEVAAGWSYYGCYSDKLANDQRVMSGITFANIGQHAVTNTKCVAYCDSKGYSMAGTEYGGQCFCANSLVGSSVLDESKCNMACEGDSSETCGGSLSLSVYSKSTTTNTRRLRNKHFHKHVRGASN